MKNIKLLLKDNVKIVLLYIVIITFFSFLLLVSAIYRTGPLEENKVVVIPVGTSVFHMSQKLEEEGIIHNPILFRFVVKITGKQGTMQAGEYVFKAKASVGEVIKHLSIGKTKPRLVTIPEGFTVKQIAKRLEEHQFSGAMPKDIAEGSLYPDTYDFRLNDTRQGIIQRMQKRMQVELNAAWLNRNKGVPLKTPQELLVLASIVEKETAVPSERARVAGVFINRLNKNMKLQSDPTVIYGASDYEGDITTVHLREDHLYNTYVHKGLPPTPIASPCRDSLQATGQPEEHDYLYFVADGLGGHVFAKTYAQHMQNVEKFIRSYRKKYKK